MRGRAFAILVVALGAAGCGGSESGSGERPALVLAVPNSSEGDALRAAAGEFGDARGVGIEIVQAPYANLFEKTANACASRSGSYDLLLLDDPWLPFFAEHGCLLELDEPLAATGGVDPDFLGPSLALCRHPYGKGSFVCLPYVGNAQMLFYNAEILAEYGLWQPPRDWHEAYEVMRRITADGQGRRFGYVLRGQEGNPVVANFMPVFWSFGGRVFDSEGRPSVNSPEAVTALEFFLKLAEISPPGVESFNADELATYLLQGLAAASINWPNWAMAFDDPSQSLVVGQMAYGPIPDGTHPGSAEIGHWLLAIGRSSARPDLAFELLEEVTSRSAMRASVERGNPPVRRSLFTDPELLAQSRYRHFPALLAAIESSTPRPRHARWPEIENALGVELSKAVAGRTTVREALDRANAAIERIIGR